MSCDFGSDREKGNGSVRDRSGRMKEEHHAGGWFTGADTVDGSPLQYQPMTDDEPIATWRIDPRDGLLKPPRPRALITVPARPDAAPRTTLFDTPVSRSHTAVTNRSPAPSRPSPRTRRIPGSRTSSPLKGAQAEAVWFGSNERQVSVMDALINAEQLEHELNAAAEAAGRSEESLGRCSMDARTEQEDRPIDQAEAAESQPARQLSSTLQSSARGVSDVARMCNLTARGARAMPTNAHAQNIADIESNSTAIDFSSHPPNELHTAAAGSNDTVVCGMGGDDDPDGMEDKGICSGCSLQ